MTVLYENTIVLTQVLNMQGHFLFAIVLKTIEDFSLTNLEQI